ncbi:AAA family ATPase [Candidatus Uhrbacteria bacterium]|nr:AAA family ATPase [Candidatus Uhrbacteria bacterium]
MFLQKLEVLGFKSFANKTDIDFLPPSAASKGITAVVGPNGSGKSNVADAIRWVLGEQSLKMLRGKKSEDVIFSGSEKRPRSGYAEVSLFLNNEDGKLPIDYSEVALSRRIYRDGESEYLINKNKVRLTDIQLLLAQANFGARSYSVIGQGMIDSVLTATPQERKEFFDEAAGVKQFQLKRHQSEIKLAAAKENLVQAEMLVSEIEPRLRSLSRQVKRLEERGALEEELRALEHQYYGRLWHDLAKQIAARQAELDKLEAARNEKEGMLDAAKAELATLERQETGTDEFSSLQAGYEKILDEKNRLREREFKVRGKIEVAQEVRRQVTTPLPLSKIIEEIGEIGKRQDVFLQKLRQAKTADDARKLADEFAAIAETTATLRARLERPAPEMTTSKEKDPAMVAELTDILAKAETINANLKTAHDSLQSYREREQKTKGKFFELQRSLESKIAASHDLERRLSESRIDMARLETRRDGLEQEMTAELKEKAEHVKSSVAPDSTIAIESLMPQIERLKYQLQLIGGIDPEAVREHEEIKSRYDFLEGQITDLRKAMDDLDRVIAELDMTIKARSESAFRNLNRDFDRYFRSLFGGGHAEMIQLKEEELEMTDESIATEAAEAQEEAPKKAGDRRIVGIEIHATPPGKKIKNIAMLSGGERALISIALICAIMVNNPSPFVVLDEVDAALDESNASRFAEILSELSARTQFIVITHNRYTMHKANVLYGVTMSDDGASTLLSINLDEVGKLKNDKKEKAKA